MRMLFKKKIYDTCIQLLQQKVKEYNASLHELTVGIENDSKSSAGDKHETARAMAQLEQEKINRQLAETNMQLELLQQINIDTQSNKVIKGSLVKTDKGFLFLSVAVGKVVIDNIIVVVLSPQSPLGKQLLGLQTKDIAEINGVQYQLEAIT